MKREVLKCFINPVLILLAPTKKRQTGRNLTKKNLFLYNHKIASLYEFKRPNLSVRWLAGDFLCRFFGFFRIFGLFLSSNILICISLDRFYAIVWPLEANAKGQLISEWIFGVFKSPKNKPKNWWISVLKSKKWCNQKDKGILSC